MSAESPSRRLVSLDVFRGATIASMVLVNNPGSDQVYTPLDHAAWNGWTFTDTVFPFFLWIAGVAITLSLRRRVEAGQSRRQLFGHVLIRSLILFGIGLFLNGFPYFHLSRIRYLGVLQRIAICYAVAAGVFLALRVRAIILCTAALLAAYWLVMTLSYVPGCGVGHLGEDCNFARWVDGLVLSGHMWSHTKVWDPEGIVSTIPAIATTLFGVLAGCLLKPGATDADKTVRLFVMGNLLLAAGLTMNHWLPINKNLWTSSYSVFMAGLASIVFAICYWIVDVQGLRRWTRPLAIYGLNAIAVFVLTGVVGRLLSIIHVGGRTLSASIFEAVFAPLASPVNASLLYALANVVFFYLIVYGMYRRGWIVRF